MFPIRLLFLALPVLLMGAAAVAWWLSGIGHEAVLDHLNGIAPDGQVRSYSVGVHDRVRGNLRIGAILLAVAAVGTFLLRHRWAAALTGHGFRAAVRGLWEDFDKRTSSGHKRFILVLLAIGTVLRAWMLFLPVTYDEAFTYTYYASRPVHIILSDYAYPNNHILHTLFVKVSTGLFGVGKVSLRLPAFIAGVLVMPLFYLFVRHMFNRYIALLTLALVASSGRLVEFSALGRGYSLTWLFMVCALLLGRRFVKEDDRTSGFLIAVVCALGMWTMPTMIYPAALVYVWLFLYLWTRYDRSFDRRLWRWLGSLGLFVAFTLLLYTPVFILNGMDRVLHHELMPESTWQTFTRHHADHAHQFWGWLVDASAPWVAYAGWIGLLFAAYVSSKYRLLVAALALGSVPLVMAQLMVAPPRVWTYTLFIFHLSSAIALFYLLRVVREKLLPSVGERTFAALTSLVLVLGLGWAGVDVLLKEDVSRSPDPRACATFLAAHAVPGDRVLTQYPCEATVEFEGLTLGLDRALFHGTPIAGATVYVVVGTAYEQAWQDVLRHNQVLPVALDSLRMVHDTGRMKTFAARLRGGFAPASAGTAP